MGAAVEVFRWGENSALLGRPTEFTQTLAAEICDRMASGQSLRSICGLEGMPAESTVRKWAVEDREGFHAQYTRAREVQMDALAEDILEIADDPTADPNRSRLQIEARKWLMSKIAPRRFGDKTQVEHTGRMTLEELVKASFQQPRERSE